MPPVSDHFERILLPVDFAPASDEAIAAGTAVALGHHHVEFGPATLHAVRLAAALASAGKAKIFMVHATPPMHYHAMYTGPVSVPHKVLDEIHQKARETSMAVLEHLRDTYCEGLDVEFGVHPGVAISVVLEEAERVSADLIVMAASGRSRVARFFVGSTADRVIRQAPCPVLVVPADQRG